MFGRVPMRELYICALDFHVDRHLLFAVGVCSDTGKRHPPCIKIFSQEREWQLKYVEIHLLAIEAKSIHQEYMFDLVSFFFWLHCQTKCMIL